MRRQDNRLGNRHANLNGQGVIEELLIGTPPEWIVDYGSSSTGRVLEISTVERNVLRYTVDDHGIFGGFALLNHINRNRFGRDAFNIHAVHLLNKGLRE